jgi:tRNA-dihydrouridine synthase A
MLGRAIYENPYLLADVDREIYGESTLPPDRREVLEKFTAFAEAEQHKGVKISALSRHVINLFAGRPGSRFFRRYISENAPKNPPARELFGQAARDVE